MEATSKKEQKKRPPLTSLNTEAMCLWFDDLGTGNEKHRFLSNFYEGETIKLPGVTWEALLTACGKADHLDRLKDWRGLIPFKTGEHAFAAMKFWGTDYTHFYDIVVAPDPNSAKALGRSRKHPIRTDWEIAKLDVMAAVTRVKYTLDRAEGNMLLDTDDKLLVEGTLWGDEVWGVDLTVAGYPGRNWLGTLLMARRAELRAERMFPDFPIVEVFTKSTSTHNSMFGVTPY